MKTAERPKLITVLFSTSLLLLSCSRTEEEKEARLGAYAGLKFGIMEVQLGIFNGSFTNSSAFLAWAQSDLSSTNENAKLLQSGCTSVWINSNYADWLWSMKRTNASAPEEEIALVGRYRFGGKDHFMGIKFDDKPIELSRPPSKSFSKLDLR